MRLQVLLFTQVPHPFELDFDVDLHPRIFSVEVYFPPMLATVREVILTNQLFEGGKIGTEGTEYKVTWYNVILVINMIL